MANWADTSYVIEGRKKTLQKIYNAIKSPALPENASEGWEGGVLSCLNIQWKNVTPDGEGHYLRGFIKDYELTDNVLTISAEEAWGLTDFAKLLKANIPNIKVYWCTEEPGMEIYSTNDSEGKYFPDRYYVNACIDGIYDHEYFRTQEEAFHWLSINTNGRVQSEEDIDEFNADYENSEGADENFIELHAIDIVND
jgi:hypothetical protein